MVICIDVDGTLTTGTAWTEADCLLAEPRFDIIEKVRKLYQVNFIVIWTARRENLLLPTIEWLRKNGVPFHAIAIGKTPADLYIDDRSVKPEDV